MVNHTCSSKIFLPLSFLFITIPLFSYASSTTTVIASIGGQLLQIGFWGYFHLLTNYKIVYIIMGFAGLWSAIYIAKRFFWRWSGLSDDYEILDFVYGPGEDRRERIKHYRYQRWRKKVATDHEKKH